MENSNSPNNKTPDDLHNNSNNNSNEQEASEPTRSFTAKGSYNPNSNEPAAANQHASYGTPPAPGSPLSNYQPMFDQPSDDPSIKKKHTGLGITSFILSLIAILLIVIGIVIAVVGVNDLASDVTLQQMQDITYWENIDVNSDMPQWLISIVIGMLFIFGSAFFAFVGTIFGIIGLVIKNRKKAFAIIGTILNGLILAGGFLLFVIGLIAS